MLFPADLYRDLGGFLGTIFGKYIVAHPASLFVLAFAICAAIYIYWARRRQFRK